MAWLLGDGFDFAPSPSSPGSIWAVVGGISSTNQNNGRFGVGQGACAPIGNFSTLITNEFTNSQTVYLNFALIINSFSEYPQVVGSPTGGQAAFGMNFMDLGNTQCAFAICLDTTMALTIGPVLHSGNPVKIAQSGPIAALAKGVWNHFQIKIVIHNTNGSIEVRLNGELNPTWSVSNVNTRNGSTNNYINNIYNSCFNNWISFSGLDDFYVFNDQGAAPNTWQGDVRAIALMPASDISTSWTANSGPNNFSRVNNRPEDGDTSYIFTNTPGNVDLYTINPFASPPLAIVGIQTKRKSRMDDTGPHNQQTKFISGGTTTLGVTGTQTTTYVWTIEPYMLNPDTSTAWNQASVEAIQLGVVDVL